MGSEAEGGGQAGDHTLRTSSDMEGCDVVSQDGAQFEDALRRLNALESKLAGQVLEDISELRKKWVQARVDRVSNNTYKLYQVRKSLKQSKMLYVEEDQLLKEFARVKAALLANSMDNNEQVRAKSGSYKSRSQSQSGDRSTGFSHLDDFEKRLAEIQDDLDTDEHKANKEP